MSEADIIGRLLDESSFPEVLEDFIAACRDRQHAARDRTDVSAEVDWSWARAKLQTILNDINDGREWGG